MGGRERFKSVNMFVGEEGKLEECTRIASEMQVQCRIAKFVMRACNHMTYLHSYVHIPSSMSCTLYASTICIISICFYVHVFPGS